MDTSKNYRKLYQYFLEVVTEKMYSKLHEEVPKPGEGMYYHLKEKLGENDLDTYVRKMKNCGYLSEYEISLLTPCSGPIKKEKLDIALYIRINSLLKEEEERGPGYYLIQARNRVCHLSMYKLAGDASPDEFKRDFDLLKKFFRKYGFTKEKVDSCEEKIFNNQR